MAEEPQDEDELPVVEGPDPQQWPAHAPELWDLILELEYLGRAQAVLAGQVVPGVVGLHSEVINFLRESGAQLRAELTVQFGEVYGLKGGPAPDSPFFKAGKARAFGVDRPPDTPTP